jgi:hypothetical protein
MTTHPVNSAFEEATAEARVQSLPLSHLSLELGHLYFEDFDDGPDRLREHFEQVAPWVHGAHATLAARLPGRPRVSTCFLIDDYFGPKRSPAQILPGLTDAAASHGLPIDYLVRESACADADGVALAELVTERIVAEPVPGTNGARPAVRDSGWLSNGQRSAAPRQSEAMSVDGGWRPPVQNAANRHSIFMDVQLWDEHNGRRRYSCAYLASVWQLLRLGLLRRAGEPVAQPRAWDGAFPEEWSQLPPVVKLNPAAAPFSAYRAHSVLGRRFSLTEQAVRTVLSQVLVDPLLADEAQRRAGAEGMPLPLEATERIDYTFTG